MSKERPLLSHRENGTHLSHRFLQESLG